MRKLVLFLGLAAVLLSASAVRAQLAPPNEAGVTMGHVHLVVQDVEGAKQFWVTMGGTATKLGPNDVVKFPGVLVFLRKGEPSGASVGSVVNHIGFYVANIQQSMDKWKAAGLKTEPGASARQGYGTTPDGQVRS